MFQHNFLSILERERYSFDEINCTTKLLNKKNRRLRRFFGESLDWILGFLVEGGLRFGREYGRIQIALETRRFLVCFFE